MEFRVIVLIDTWWNVNSTANCDRLFAPSVLIDTWWNVNKYDEDDNPTDEYVLIDTWWNVNPLPAALVHSNPPF